MVTRAASVFIGNGIQVIFGSHGNPRIRRELERRKSTEFYTWTEDYNFFVLDKQHSKRVSWDVEGKFPIHRIILFAGQFKKNI